MANTVVTTWTSFLKPLMNSGRIGRSIRRLVRVSFWEGAPSAAREAAGDLARGVELLLVVHGQGEEVLTRLGALGEYCGRQHDGFAVGGEDRARQPDGPCGRFRAWRGLAPPLDGLFLDVEHFCFFLVPRAYSRRGRQGSVFRKPHPVTQAMRAFLETLGACGAQRIVRSGRRIEPPAPATGSGLLRLATQTELLDQGLVAPGVGRLEVIQQRTALGHQLQQPTARMVVLLVVLKCSVRLAIRSVRIATWTSALPVSAGGTAVGQ